LATRSQKIKVSVFLLGNLIVLGGMFALIAGFNTTETIPYTIYFDESVLGLYEQSLVEYLGVPVGKVSNIRVNEAGLAEVTIEVEPDKVEIRRGVTAKIVIFSLATGAMAISLSGGEKDALLLEAKSVIPTSPSAFASFQSQLQDLTDTMKRILTKIDDGLAGMEEGALVAVVDEVKGMLEDGRTFVASVDVTVARLEENLTPSLDELKGLLSEARGMAEQGRDLVGTVQSKVDEVEPGVMQGDLKQVLDRLDGLLADLQSAAETFDTTSQAVSYKMDNVEYGLRDLLRTATDALTAVKDLAEYLQEDPSALIRGPGRARGD
jgi:phospholipid/cholesterol/gamma-HCH transport system substrate-binding protein